MLFEKGFSEMLNTKAKALLRTGFFLWLFFLSPFTFADKNPSDVILDRATIFLDEFDANRKKFEKDKVAFLDMVDRIGSPAFDFFYISKLVMGKNWKKTTHVQRKEFANVFKKLMLLTYSTALFRYSGNGEIEFTDKQIKQRKNVRFAEVESKIAFSGENIVFVTYYLLDIGEGWKIYNLHVGGLDMVLYYRDVLDPLFREKGVAGVIEYMQKNNEENY